MMLRVDPSIELFAASVPDLDWDIALLRNAGDLIRWISIHEYWDPAWEVNNLSDYEGAMRASAKVDDSIEKTEAILRALGFEDRIRIAFDEWNLRGWHHPGVMDFSHLIPDHAECEAHREKNEDDSSYTMADAVFSACFLNACLRHAKTVGMANFSPIVNTRGAIHVFPDGLVLRPVYHVFKLYADHMGSTVADGYMPEAGTFKAGADFVSALDMVATTDDRGALRVSLVNRHPDKPLALDVVPRGGAFSGRAALYTVNGPDKDSYNDAVHPDTVSLRHRALIPENGLLNLVLEPHSANVLVWEKEKA
jgi:alpha-N-arabinofuranosidase